MSLDGTSQPNTNLSGSSEVPRRWLVVGSGGAGKTRFSIELGRILALPVIHLDRYFWGPDWSQPDREEWGRTVADLCGGDAWVIDGNYSGSLRRRLERAEAVVLLDVPTWRCLAGIYARALRKGPAPDRAEGCSERLPTWDFVRFVATYRIRSLPKVLERIREVDHVRFHHLGGRAGARAFLDELAAGSPA